MKEKCENKKSPAQRFGEETARAFSGARDEGEVRSDTLGSYTGVAHTDAPHTEVPLIGGPLIGGPLTGFSGPSVLENDTGIGRLGPGVLGAESVQFSNPIMELLTEQDPDDL